MSVKRMVARARVARWRGFLESDGAEELDEGRYQLGRVLCAPAPVEVPVDLHVARAGDVLADIPAGLDGHEWIPGAMHHQGGDRDRRQDGPHVDLEVAPLDLGHHLRGAGVALELGQEPARLRRVGDVLDVDPAEGAAGSPVSDQRVDEGLEQLR